MYANCFNRPGRAPFVGASLLAIASLCGAPRAATAQQMQGPSVVRNISKANERLEMTVNSSQILTLGTRIPRIVVNNPELVTATPISETQVQIAARKPGVTQINLWDENGNIFTVDLLIFGDVRELELALKTLFPQSSIQVTRLTNSLVLNGQVDRPEIVSTVFRLAEDYAPKVVSNLNVGGVQQVILKVKVMEVSRTKLRRLAMDFGIFGDNGAFVTNAAGVINEVDLTGGSVGALGQTVSFGVFGNDANLFAFLDALQQSNVSKVLADPTLTTVSGRPASFLVGGETPVPVPQGNSGQITIEYKKFGTQIDFVPIVLGNGRIRLEVRPEISELDFTAGVSVGGNFVPGLKTRRIDTGVEMNAGQTLALAGLIQEKVDSRNRGVPYVSDIPYIGVPFRRMEETVSEVENLILVTPDFADAMDPHEVPPCGPGMETMSPSNGQLYWKGMIEVPACGPCGASDPCVCPAPGQACNILGGGNCGAGGGSPYMGGAPMGPEAMATDSMQHGGMQVYGGPMGSPYGGQTGAPVQMSPPTPADPTLPAAPAGPTVGPQLEPVFPGQSGPPDPAARRAPPPWQRTAALPAQRATRPNPSAAPTLIGPSTSTPGLIGPIGYDVQK